MNDTLQEAVGCHWVSSLALRTSRQNQKPSDPLLHHNQTPPPRLHHRTELLSELRPDAGEHAGRGNEPVCERKHFVKFNPLAPKGVYFHSLFSFIKLTTSQESAVH